MIIISDSIDFKLNNKTAVAMGKFDGVHMGHMLLIDRIKSISEEEGISSVVFTFNPSPESLFAGHALPELTTLQEKRRLFEQLGIDYLIEFPMNRDTAATEPDVFIRKFLSEQMNASYIVAGEDVSYGNRGLGDAELLRKLSDECGYVCDIVPKVMDGEQVISSTLVRQTVLSGDMELAERLLGSPYRVSGVVSHGRKLGRTIGMPTANLILPPDKLIGPKGVYYSRAYIDGEAYPSTSNVGVKPTVADDELLCCETYIYGFDEDIYGRFIEVELLKFVRPEMCFAGVDELKNQMRQDLTGGAMYHGVSFAPDACMN